MLGDLLCGRVEDMPDVIKDESSRLPTGLGPGMVQVSVSILPNASCTAHVIDSGVCCMKAVNNSGRRSGGLLVACGCAKELGAAQAKHRRIRRWDVLWRVYDLAVQWRALAKRQEARQADVEEAMDHP